MADGLSTAKERLWINRVAGAGVIVFAVFGVYWPALGGRFLWDDLLVVHRNPLVTGDLTLSSIWYRTDFPLSNVAFWLEWLAWGKDPVGYHVVNVLLHATSAMLLWRVLAQLRVPGSWLAGMIYAVHPVCVGSVAWISELKNTLSLPFLLVSLLWYVRWDSARWASTVNESEPVQVGPDGGAGWYWLSLGAFLLALLSKTSTVMLPVVLLGCVWWQRGRVGWADVLRAGPFFVLAVSFGMMSVWFQAHGAIAGATVQSENFWGRLAGAGMALWFYSGKAVAPLGLNMIYPRWKIDAAAAWSYLPLALWCGLLVACWVLRRTWGRHVLFGLGCFTVLLFPVLGFFDMYYLMLSRVSDHLVYLPLVALVALGAAGLSRALRGKVLWVAGAVWVVGLALLGMARARVFVNEEALWRDTLAKNPAAWCAQANLGWIMAEHGKYDEAREHLEASLSLKEDNAQAHSNLGRVLSLEGEFDKAEPHFQRALELKPKDFDIRCAYASALAEQGRKAEAVGQLRQALRLRTDMNVRLQLATLLYQTHQFREALEEYQQVLAVKPDQLEALSNLAWLLATCPDGSIRNGAEAVRLAERACRVSGYRQARALGALGAAYAEAGRFPEAAQAAQMAIKAARASGEGGLAVIGEQLLRLFREGKPYRQAPAGAAPPAAQ